MFMDKVLTREALRYATGHELSIKIRCLQNGGAACAGLSLCHGAAMGLRDQSVSA
jgi:hypothetical protein